MKNTTKILIVALCITLLAALAVIAISANDTIANDAQLEQLYVTTGGTVRINFVYSDFGSATKMVAEIAAPGSTEPTVREYAVADIEDKTVSVTLSPNQMHHTVTVYAEDENGVRGEGRAYSVVEYANYILSNGAYAEWHNEMRTLLNWGAMADIYFGGHTTSQINYGIFTHGTNSVAAVNNSFAEETDGVVDGEAIKIAGYQMFLAPEDTSLRMYFTYEGNPADLSVEISKNGEYAGDAPVRLDSGVENLYFVNLKNIGVEVFDVAYTATITNGEDTASVTKTALEYLNTIAFGEDYTEAQHNLSKSMYQFYTFANELDPTECAHTIKHKTIEIEDGKGVEYDVCSACFAKFATHNNITSGKTVNNNGTTTYTYTCNCAECEGKVVYRKTLNNTVYHADITTVTATLVDTDGDTAPVSVSMNEDGMVYAHVEAAGRQVETVITAENVPANMVMVLKLRLNNGEAPVSGKVHATVEATDGTQLLSASDTGASNEDLVKRHNDDLANDGWVVGRINVKGNFGVASLGTAGLTSGTVVTNFTIRIVHYDDLDISYFVTDPSESNTDALPYVYSMGDDYYLHWDKVICSYRDNEWRKINDAHTGGIAQNDPFTPVENTRTPLYVEEEVRPEGHNITSSKEVGETTTTYKYTCNCAECQDKVVSTRTAGNEVFNLDLTAFSTGEMKYDEATGRVYRHFPANGHETTTTVTIDNVPYGIVMFVKYRLNNGATPTQQFTTRVEYGGITGTTLNGLMANGTATASDLATYHEGWVVGRINAKGNGYTNGILPNGTTAIPADSSLAQSITITFVHREDLDLEFFITDDGEDNAGAFQTLYDSGDKYYLVTANAVLGTHSGTNRWREIPATGTTAITITDAALEGYKTPYLRDAAANAPEEPEETTTETPEETTEAPEEPEEPVGHQLTLVQDSNYYYYYTCNCADCEGKRYQEVGLNNTTSIMDISKITSTGTVSTVIENEQVYQHIATNGAEVTTTIKIENAPMAMALFMKYRLNGTAVPTAGITAGITYVVDGKSFYVNTTDISAATLATYHQDWVVGRVNMKSTFNSTTAGKAYIKSDNSFSATATSMTITITHSQDLDVEFVYGDAYENNQYVFPVLYATGNKYYLVQTVFGAHSGTNRWRIVPASGTTTVTWIDNATYKTPYLEDAAAQ